MNTRMDGIKMNRTTYVRMLPNVMQKKIEKDLHKSLMEINDFTHAELEEHVQNGMDSRLCDLSDTINIIPYVAELECTFIGNMEIQYEEMEDTDSCKVYYNEEFYFILDKYKEEIFHSYSLDDMYHEIKIQGHKIVKGIE